MNNWTYKKRDLINESYDDSDVKNLFIEVSKDILGFKTIINTKNNGKGIDLVSMDNPLVGVELERGGWVGDFWTDDYSLISNLGFRTLNMPDRKEKYWLPEYQFYGKIIKNPSWNLNYFIRTNFFFTQICVVEPEIITNQEKTIKTSFQAKNNKRGESWLCWKRENVKTYNLINGEFILDTDENGSFTIMNEDEKNELVNQKIKIKKEITKAEDELRLKRAIEVYKQKQNKIKI